MQQSHAVSCVVYNRAPDFSQASVQVHKRWRVHAAGGITDYPNGRQPTELQGSLSLGGPGPAAPTAQSWDAERAGYDTDTDSPVTIAEQVEIGLPGCELTEVSIEDGAPGDSTPGSGQQLAPSAPTAAKQLAGGENEWTLTNEVRCRSFLTLHKEVASGEADPRWWELTAIAPAGALPGPSGRDGSDDVTRVEVTPNVAYALAETADSEPHMLRHYVQNDQRSRPLVHPDSTGSWNCDVVGPGTMPAGDLGTEGAITVPLGMHIECIAVNQTALLTVVKDVRGGDAAPEDFAFQVTPLDPVLPGGHPDRIPGAGSPDGTTVNVTPGQRYQLSEVSGPDGYELTRLTCLTSDSILNARDMTLLPGAHAGCQAVNQVVRTTLTVAKTEADTGDQLPGATFDLVYDDDANGYDSDNPVVGTCTTDEPDGTCSVTGRLDFGDYYWVETGAPPGHQLPGDPVSEPVTVTGSTAGTSFPATRLENSQTLTHLRLIKTDGESGQPLPGARFQLYRDADGAEPGNVPAADDEPVGSECTTGTDGMCTAEDVVFGTYYWYEVEPAPGYPLPADRTSPLITVNTTNAGQTQMYDGFTNARIPGETSVLKLDAINDKPLAGASFTLYTDSNGNGAYDDGTDEAVHTCSTNDNGGCTREDLAPGTYFWVETAAPTGYELPDDTVGEPVTITPDNVDEPQRRTFHDPRKTTTLAVDKRDAADDAPLAGAIFELYRDSDSDGPDGPTDAGPDPDDKRIGHCTTGDNGRCQLNGLDFGTYYWFEATAPDGYTLPDDRTSSMITIDAANAGTALRATTFHDTENTAPPPPEPPHEQVRGPDLPGQLVSGSTYAARCRFRYSL